MSDVSRLAQVIRESSSPADFGKVAVVMGGWSAERDVSLMSGQPVLGALSAAGVDAHAVDAGRDIGDVLVQGGFDRAFLILHGRGGEDGTVQAALELAGIPYTGTGVLGSAVGMDKWRAKQLCVAAGIPTPACHLVTSLDDVHNAVSAIGGDVVIKPLCEGSSLGVTIVRGGKGVDAAWTDASRYGDVLVEAFMPGPEVTAAVLDIPAVGLQSLPLVSMRAAGGFYDYDAKYLLDTTEYDCPAQLSTDVTDQISSLALNAFKAIGCSGWGRIDFMIDAAGNPQFIECNTAPGMTGHSLVPMAAAEVGIDYEHLCLAILRTSMHQERSGKQHLPATEAPAQAPAEVQT